MVTLSVLSDSASVNQDAQATRGQANDLVGKLLQFGTVLTALLSTESSASHLQYLSTFKLIASIYYKRGGWWKLAQIACNESAEISIQSTIERSNFAMVSTRSFLCQQVKSKGFSRIELHCQTNEQEKKEHVGE